MRILDKYILRFFFASLLWCILAFVSFYIIIDLFGRLNIIMERKTPLEIVINYYLSLIPLVFVQMCPLAALLSTMHTLANFSKNNELTAAVAGGIHPHRILVPFILSAFILSLISMVVNEKNVPDAARNAYRIKEIRIKGIKEQYLWRDRIFYGSANRKFYVKLLDAKKNFLERIEITEYSQNGVELSKFHANTGRWIRVESNTGKRVKSEWLFYNATLREFDSGGRVKLTIQADEVKVDERGWVFLKGNVSTSEGKKFFQTTTHKLPKIEEIPEDFTKKQLRAQEMNFQELSGYIKRLQKMGFNPQSELVSLHNKISLPFANLVVILIGIPFAVRQRRGGILVGFGNALAICLIYYLLQSVGSVLGESFIPAILGAWFANVIFTVYGIINLRRVPYLSS